MERCFPDSADSLNMVMGGGVEKADGKELLERGISKK